MKHIKSCTNIVVGCSGYLHIHVYVSTMYICIFTTYLTLSCHFQSWKFHILYWLETHLNNIWNLLCILGSPRRISDPVHWKYLRRHGRMLKDDLELSDLLNPLFSAKIITKAEKSTIQSTQGDQVQILIDILYRNPADMYHIFLQVLRDNNQGHVADGLQEGSSRSSSERS